MAGSPLEVSQLVWLPYQPNHRTNRPTLYRPAELPLVAWLLAGLQPEASQLVPLACPLSRRINRQTLSQPVESPPAELLPEASLVEFRPAEWRPVA